MTIQSIKWGMIGAGMISSWVADDLVQTEGAELIAVASRSLERAESFAQKYNVPRSYGSYEELLNDSDVDVVYIGTLHPMHKKDVLACLHAGKSVLCEKPFTINASEAKEIVEVAREKKLFVMEAMWTRFLPAIVQARAWMQSDAIGEVRLLKADFGFDVGWQPDGRLLNKELGGGALLDAGIYPVSFASMVFGAQPTKITSNVRIGETGVDEQSSLLFEYEDGRSAVLNSAVRLNLTNDAYIYGTKGYIHIPNFLAANSATLYVKGEEPVQITHERSTRGYNFEVLEVMECLRNGALESSVIPLDETIQIMQTLDTIRGQWGLKYPTE